MKASVWSLSRSLVSKQFRCSPCILARCRKEALSSFRNPNDAEVDTEAKRIRDLYALAWKISSHDMTRRIQCLRLKIECRMHDFQTWNYKYKRQESRIRFSFCAIKPQCPCIDQAFTRVVVAYVLLSCTPLHISFNAVIIINPPISHSLGVINLVAEIFDVSTVCIVVSTKGHPLLIWKRGDTGRDSKRGCFIYRHKLVSIEHARWASEEEIVTW